MELINFNLDLHECRHSMIVVASTRYPPQRIHIRWWFISVTLILVIRFMMTSSHQPPNLKLYQEIIKYSISLTVLYQARYTLNIKEKA